MIITNICIFYNRYILQFCILLFPWLLASLAYVLVSSGCSDKILQTGWLNRRHVFSNSSGGWEFLDQGVSRFGFWGGPSSRFADSPPSCCILTRPREKELGSLPLLLFFYCSSTVVSTPHPHSPSSSYKATNSIMGTPPSWPQLNLITSKRPHLQTPSQGTSTYEF